MSEIPFVELRANPSDSILIVGKVKVENFYLKYKILLKRHKDENMSTPIMGMLCCSPCVCVWNGLSCTRKSRYWEKLPHGEVVRHWKRLLRGVVEFPPLKCSEKCVGVALEDVVWWWTGGLEYSKVFPNISNSMILSEITIFSEQSQNQSNSVVKKDFHSTRAGPWKSLIKNIKSICITVGQF